MPYIEDKDRRRVTHRSVDKGDLITIDGIETAGDLQFAIALLIKSYMKRKGLRYQNCNDVMGALAGAQMEFYRRTVAPYESKKIDENGDV